MEKEIKKTFGDKKSEKFSQDWYSELLKDSKSDLIEFIKLLILETEKVKEKYSESKKYSSALEDRIRFLRKHSILDKP